MDIVFIILNYNIFKETVDCVNSIKKNIDTERYHIIIVDNASKNEAGNCLKDKFAKDEKVTVITTKNNLGFANGNNYGIDYAKKQFDFKYICCLNNDTLLEIKDFYYQIDASFSKEQSAVIGPKIILRNGETQQLMGRLLPIEDYRSQLSYLMGRNTFWNRLKTLLLSFKIVNKLNNYRHKIFISRLGDFNPDNLYKDVILHGSCLIFTPKFFMSLKGFDPRTFMFREEELLYIMLLKNGLHNLYNPNIEIKHLEDVSTDSVYKDKDSKNKFLLDNQINSLKILIQELA